MGGLKHYIDLAIYLYIQVISYEWEVDLEGRGRKLSCRKWR